MNTELNTKPARDLITADETLRSLATIADDTGLAAALNAKTIDGNVPVSTAEVKRQAILQGYYSAIVLASRANDEAAIAAVGYVDDPRFSTMDLSLPAVQAMIAALVSTKVMTQEQADALNAMGVGKISLAEQLYGVGTVITNAGELR